MLLAALLAFAIQQQVVEMQLRVTIPVDPPAGAQAVIAHRRRWLVRSAPYVQLTWLKSDDLKSPPQSGAGYRVYKAAGNGAFAPLASGLQTLSLTDKAVKKNTSYRYYVTALIGKVESKPTRIVAVTP